LPQETSWADFVQEEQVELFSRFLEEEAELGVEWRAMVWAE
jgi:hypothetical protein